jgi:hypothetical protein
VLGLLPRVPIRIGELELVLDIHIVKATNYDILLENDFLHLIDATINYNKRILQFRLDHQHVASVPISFEANVAIDMFTRAEPIHIPVQEESRNLHDRPEWEYVPSRRFTPRQQHTSSNSETSFTSNLMLDNSYTNFELDTEWTDLTFALDFNDLDEIAETRDAPHSSQNDTSSQDKSDYEYSLEQRPLDDNRPDDLPNLILGHSNNEASDIDDPYLDEVFDSYVTDQIASLPEACLSIDDNEFDKNNIQPTSDVDWRSALGGSESSISGMVEDLWSIQREEDLTLEQRKALTQLLSQFQDAFLWKNQRLGYTDLVTHHIHTDNQPPIKQKAYRLSHRERELICKEVQQMLEDRIIEESESPWVSCPVIIKKKDGGVRFCIDLRKVNAATEKDSYPLPRIDDLMDEIGKAKWFFLLDLKWGYWQIALDPEAKVKIAFTTTMGLHQFRVMAFGLCNAPCPFQRLMDVVLRPFIGKFCSVSLDDILIYSDTFAEHMTHLRHVFSVSIDAHLHISPKKCSFGMQELLGLGHIISKDGLTPDPTKVASVRDFLGPTTIFQLRGFLGLCGYYRRYVQSFSQVAGPLTELLKKEVPFSWGSEQQEAFDTLKARLSSPPILVRPDFLRRFLLKTDYSGTAIGAILAQKGLDGFDHVIAYASKSLTPAERNYSTTEGECLAVVWGIKHFRPYLFGTKFILVTDHASLKWLMNSQDLNTHLMRWSLKLQEYDFDIKYKPGRNHSDVDALSRIPPTPPSSPLPEYLAFMAGGLIDEDVSFLQEEATIHNVQSLREEAFLFCQEKLITKEREISQQNAEHMDNTEIEEPSFHGPEIEESPSEINFDLEEKKERRPITDILEDQPTLYYLKHETLPQNFLEKRRVKLRAKTYTWDGETLRTKPNTRYPQGRIVPSYERRKELLEWAHNGTNHMGPLKLEKLIQETNWWYRLMADCENLCWQCANCALASADFKVEKTN